MEDGQHTPREKMRAASAALVALMVFAILWALVGVSYLTYLSYQQSSSNSELIRQAEDTNQRIVDCTVPSGKCYKRGQKQTAEAIVGINEGTMQVVVAVVSCQADGVTETEALAKCAVRRAKKLAKEN